MSTSRNKNYVYAIFADKFMISNILDSIRIHSTRIFYDYFHLKIDPNKLLISKCNVLYPVINSMFIAKNEDILNSSFKKNKT